jgi:hypothetical protein
MHLNLLIKLSAHFILRRVQEFKKQNGANFQLSNVSFSYNVSNFISVEESESIPVQ